MVFRPQIEDFVGSVPGESVLRSTPVWSWHSCGQSVCMGALCSSCVCQIQPEPSPDPGIQDGCCRIEYICTQNCAQIVFVHRKDLLWQMEDKLFNRRCKNISCKEKCIVFSYTPPWEIIFISRGYQCIFIVIGKGCCRFVKKTHLVAEAHFRSFDCLL